MSRHDVRVQRLISAPIDMVFRHWTDPDERLQWCAPDPSWSADAGSDPREGGEWWVTFGPHGGPTYRIEGVYRVVEPPHRLVYSSAFHDADGSTVCTEITVTFEARERWDVAHRARRRIPGRSDEAAVRHRDCRRSRPLRTDAPGVSHLTGARKGECGGLARAGVTCRRHVSARSRRPVAQPNGARESTQVVPSAGSTPAYR